MFNWHFISNPRALAAFFHDLFVAIIVWLLAYWIRFNFDIPTTFLSSMWLNLLWVLPVQLSCFLVFGLYQGVWRFASIPDLKRILKAIGVAGLLVAAAYLMLKPFGVIPRSVLLLDPILLLLAMGASRFAYRAWKEHHQYGALIGQGKPVIVLGAGEAAVAFKESNGVQEANFVSPIKPSQFKRVVVSKSHFNDETKFLIDSLGEVKLVYVGSSLKFCKVAEGLADIYPRLAPTCEWDTAAAQAVLEGAGGIVVDISGKSLRYGKSSTLNPSFIASSSIEIIKSLLDPNL